MRKVWGDMPDKGDIGGDKWNQVAEHVNDNFFFIDMERYTLESVLRKGAELVNVKVLNVLLLIHLTRLETLIVRQRTLTVIQWNI